MKSSKEIVEICLNIIEKNMSNLGDIQNMTIYHCLLTLREISMNLDIFQETKLGEVAEQLKEHPKASQNVKLESNVIFKKWKKLVRYQEIEDASEICCDYCGDENHYPEAEKETACPFTVICEDFSVKSTGFFKEIDVKRNDTLTEIFEIHGLPPEIFSVKIKTIKMQDEIEIVKKRVLVQQDNKIRIEFKFLAPKSLNSTILANMFVCEVAQKLLNDDSELVHEISQTQKEKEENYIFKLLINSLKENRITWDSFAELVCELTITLKQSKYLNDLLLQELKNYRNDKKLKAKAELFAKRAKQISNQQAQDDNRIQDENKVLTKKLDELKVELEEWKNSTKNMQKNVDEDIAQYVDEIVQSRDNVFLKNTNLVQKCANQNLELKLLKKELVEAKNKFEEVQGILIRENTSLSQKLANQNVELKLVKDELVEVKNKFKSDQRILNEKNDTKHELTTKNSIEIDSNLSISNVSKVKEEPKLSPIQQACDNAQPNRRKLMYDAFFGSSSNYPEQKKSILKGKATYKRNYLPVTPGRTDYTSSNDSSQEETSTSNWNYSKNITLKQNMDFTEELASYVKAKKKCRWMDHGVKILIFNLKHDVTNEDLNDLFEDLGIILDISIDKSKQFSSEAVGEIIFSSRKEAKKAVEKYDKKFLDGRKMKIVLDLEGKDYKYEAIEYPYSPKNNLINEVEAQNDDSLETRDRQCENCENY